MLFNMCVSHFTVSLSNYMEQNLMIMLQEEIPSIHVTVWCINICMNVHYWAVLYAARIKAISHTSHMFHFRCISKVVKSDY